MQEFNKTTAAVIAGALVTVAAAFVPADYKTPELVGAGQTLITAALVYFVPNKPAAP